METNIPLSMRNYQTRSLSIEVEKAAGEVEEQNEALDFDFDVFAKPGDALSQALTFKIAYRKPLRSMPGNCLSIRCEMLGLFELSETLSEDERNWVIRFNGCTILYGIARGILLNATGTFPDEPVLLPTILFRERVQEINRRKVEARDKKTGKEATPKNKSASKAPGSKVASSKSASRKKSVVKKSGTS